MTIDSLNLDFVLHRILAEISQNTGIRIRQIEREAAEALEAYSWPGNTSEMYKVLKIAALRDRSGVIRRSNLPEILLNEAIRIQDSAMERCRIFRKSGNFPYNFRKIIISKKGLARLLEFSYSS